MANILLGVTGSVAAIYTPELVVSLTGNGHAVKVVATKAACYFFDPVHIMPAADGQRNRDFVILDEDEWNGQRYQRGDSVLHIELRRWADLLLIAPLDANTLAKMALGLCDNCLTCVYRAWDRSRPVVLAPAMNTLMWEQPATWRHLRQIAEDLTGISFSQAFDETARRDLLSLRRPPLTIVPPVVKQLACEDIGIGALADRAAIVQAVVDSLPSPGPSRPGTC